ncbi:MAG: ATP-dependent Clp protease ATP-binding subunit [Clostridia bacterium]|nr:ATP-dependent Clp protease ATP-binding subunit [Clostridia bacterium]
MEIQKCARCQKRPAVVFITRLEAGKTVNEGLCLICAKDLGIKPINDILKKMGVSDEDIENMTGEMEGLIEAGQDLDGGAPAIDFPKIFSNMNLPFNQEGVSQEKKDARTKKNEKADGGRKFLNMYATNLTAKAQQGRIDRMIGRERELDRVIQILCRRQKNNPCLIGEPGVGKTAIAEALAQRIVDNTVPERLHGCELWLLDLTSLVAGTQFRGQFEQRILGLIREVKQAGNIILMIDEVHSIVGAGDSEGSMSAANILKPALSRGEIQVIGATTLKEYRKHIEKDSALERRFQPVVVEEPSVEDTVEILRGIKGYYETYHGVKISDEVARLAVIMSERYITDRFLPDKAIDLLDEAAARASLTSAELNEMRRAEKTLAEIEKKKEALEAKLENQKEQTEQNYKTLADLKVEKLRLEGRLDSLRPMLENLYLTPNDIAGVIEIWTGIPATDIKENDFGALDTLEEKISSQLIGQEEAVSAVVRAVKRKRAGVSYRKTPISMIFAGPTGVGKTELVKVLAMELFKQPESLIRLDMSEFMEKHAVSRIIGAPPGYVGYDEAGQLTEKIRRRPYSVVLFDEIEKAHPDVMNILLQVLDDGKITDAQGRAVNFENTIIVMTTNAGSETSSAISGFSMEKSTVAKDKTERALSSFLRPEFLNRIDEIVTFNSLTEEDFVAIAKLMTDKVAAHMAEKGIRITFDDAVLAKIAKESYSEKFGARNMRRYIEKNIEDLLAAAVIEHYKTRLSGVHFSVKENKISMDCI